MREYVCLTNGGAEIVRARSRGGAVCRAFALGVDCKVTEAVHPTKKWSAVIHHAPPQGPGRSTVELIGTGWTDADISTLDRQSQVRRAVVEGLGITLTRDSTEMEYSPHARGVLMTIRDAYADWTVLVPCTRPQYELSDRLGGPRAVLSIAHQYRSVHIGRREL